MTIHKAAVLGSGVMGSGIAAHLANAGVEVLLFDIVPKDGKDRTAIAKGAMERLAKQRPAPVMHPDFLKRIMPCNMEDDLEKLRECDWIVEAVLEKLEIKHKVYSTIEPFRKPDAVVSSNTSTIPLHELLTGRNEGFRKYFMITHFFNPPRYMRLLELVKGAETDEKAYNRMKEFVHINLGKGYVACNDTPGFIANRIGVYWLMLGLLEGIRLNINVEDADAVMGKPLGIPKTGVFGLFDLIGIDLMPLIAKELRDTLPPTDPFCQMYQEPERVTRMIAEGYTGRKGKGGFYRLNTEGGGKKKESLVLATGDYRAEQKSALASVEAAKGGLRALVEHSDIGGHYAAAVLLPVLHYAASLIPEIAGDIVAVDRAMRWGYNWKFGPFELIDKLGTDFFATWCKKNGHPVPEIIMLAQGEMLYSSSSRLRGEAGRGVSSVSEKHPPSIPPASGGEATYLTLKGTREVLPKPAGVLFLSDKKAGAKPVKKNGSASLWDLGDGVLGLEYTSKMNSMDPDILSMMEASHAVVKEGFKGLVIATDADNFSYGANLGFFLFAANTASWGMLSDVIKQGQNALMGLKHAPFPVVAALNGMALGGGCETILHCDAIQAHAESYPGLVEVGVGVIPGWGGCKEMLFRHLTNKKLGFGGTMPAVKTVFETIALAKVAESAEQARELGILNEKSRISMNRDRLLQDAKNLCLELAVNYTPPAAQTITLPGKSGRIALDMAVKGLAALGKVTPHDQTVVGHLTHVLTGGDASSNHAFTEQDILNLEHDHFMQLVKLKPTLDRIQYMLENNKPLRN